MSQELTRDQMELIATLKSTPGYVLLLDAVQAEIDYIADAMEAGSDKLLPLWRALRKTLLVLRTTPENLHAQLAEEAAKPEADAAMLQRNPSMVQEMMRRYAEQLKQSQAAPPFWTSAPPPPPSLPSPVYLTGYAPIVPVPPPLPPGPPNLL